MLKINTSLPYFIDNYAITSLIDKIEEVKEGIKEEEAAELSWNSLGGSVYAGQLFADYLNNKDTVLNANVTGIAASMGAVLLAFFDHTKGANQSDVMLHSVSGGIASTRQHTNQFLYKALAKKINEDKFQKITGYDLKTIMLAEGEDRKDVWFTGEDAKEMGLFDESYDLLSSKSNSLEIPSDDIGYTIPDHVKHKYNKSEENNNTKIDMEIKDLKIDKLKAENIELYNSIIEAGKEAGKAEEKNRVAEIFNYAKHDIEKANELVKSGASLSIKDVEYFMEKKFNAKTIEDLEESSPVDLKAAKTTKDKEDDVDPFEAEKKAMREESGVNEILKDK